MLMRIQEKYTSRKVILHSALDLNSLPDVCWNKDRAKTSQSSSGNYGPVSWIALFVKIIEALTVPTGHGHSSLKNNILMCVMCMKNKFLGHIYSVCLIYLGPLKCQNSRQIRPNIQDHDYSKTLLNTPPQYKRGGLRQAESTSVFMVMENKSHSIRKKVASKVLCYHNLLIV